MSDETRRVKFSSHAVNPDEQASADIPALSRLLRPKLPIGGSTRRARDARHCSSTVASCYVSSRLAVVTACRMQRTPGAGSSDGRGEAIDPEDTPRGRRLLPQPGRTLTRLACIASWFVLNMIIANLNKWIFHRYSFRYPALLTDLHMLASFVPGCADTYVPEPPYCTYGLREPASCVLYVPKAQGSLWPGGAPM